MSKGKVVNLEEVRARKIKDGANDVSKLKCIMLNKQLLEHATYILNFLEESGFIRFRWVNSDFDVLENGKVKLHVRAEVYIPVGEGD